MNKFSKLLVVSGMLATMAFLAGCGGDKKPAEPAKPRRRPQVYLPLDEIQRQRTARELGGDDLKRQGHCQGAQGDAHRSRGERQGHRALPRGVYGGFHRRA